jgi:hypothetical protein
MRTIGFNATAKAVAASSVVTFSQSDIGASTGLVAIIGKIAGTGNGRNVGSGGVTRMVVKADNVPVLDWAFPHYRAAMKSLRGFYPSLKPFSQAALGAGGIALTSDQGAGVGAAESYIAALQPTGDFILPLNFFDRSSELEQDQCQFPPGAAVSVELYTGATITSSATIMLGWITTNQPATFSSMFCQQFLNFTANGTGQRANISQPGYMRGLTVPGHGVTRYRLQVSGVELAQIQGTLLESTLGAGAVVAVNDGSLLRAASRIGNTVGDFFGVNVDCDTNPDHEYISADCQLPLASGSSFLEADTSTAWLTSTPENTAAVWTYQQLARR